MTTIRAVNEVLANYILNHMSLSRYVFNVSNSIKTLQSGTCERLLLLKEIKKEAEEPQRVIFVLYENMYNPASRHEPS